MGEGVGWNGEPTGEGGRVRGQGEVFAGGEGDRWFERNRESLDQAEWEARDPVLKLIALGAITPGRALEVGAANGRRMAVLRERFGCEATAVDPSQAAIEDGRGRFPEVTFVKGLADSLPLHGGVSFDLVIVHAVFHWIDRRSLLASVAEVDRVLYDGGYLIIGDFMPSRPQRIRYHHLTDADVWTFKQDYSKVFTASNLYELLAHLPYEAGTGRLCADAEPDRRAGVSLLRKDLARYEVGPNRDAP